MDVPAIATTIHNTWLDNYIAPGPVGSVGATHIHNRLKHSHPDLPIRWDPFTAGKKEQRLGSGLTDGDTKNSYNGRFARTIDHNWDVQRHKTYRKMYRFQNLLPEDMTHSAMGLVGPLPQYTWRNKVGRVYRALHTGANFLPVPGPYILPQGQIPRGGNIPAIVTSSEPLTNELIPAFSKTLTGLPVK